MRRTIWTVAASLSLASLAGCDDSPQHVAGRAAGLPEKVPASTAGAIPAEKATGVWDRGQVEIYLKDTLKLTEVALIPAGEHNYTGTGKTADGRTLRLKVSQAPGGIVCTHEDGQGGTGRIAFGNPVPGA